MIASPMMPHLNNCVGTQSQIKQNRTPYRWQCKQVQTSVQTCANSHDCFPINSSEDVLL